MTKIDHTFLQGTTGAQQVDVVKTTAGEVAPLPLSITREVAEIVVAMQVKAVAYDDQHPNNPLGTWSAADYTRAIAALIRTHDAQEAHGAGVLMAEASRRAFHLFMLAHAECGRLM